MRKPIKPFAVETRRAGRTPVGRPAKAAPSGDDEAPKSPAQPDWPPLPAEDDSYVAAMRAADALFSRPAPEPASAPASEPSEADLLFTPPAPQEPPRRILQSLNEDDHISRLLAEQEEDRPRRGRKPREAGETLAYREPHKSEASIVVDAQADMAMAAGEPVSGDIPGYVRGEIYGRYARHDRTRPGEHWRKRSLKPLW